MLSPPYRFIFGVQPMDISMSLHSMAIAALSAVTFVRPVIVASIPSHLAPQLCDGILEIVQLSKEHVELTCCNIHIARCRCLRWIWWCVTVTHDSCGRMRLDILPLVWRVI